MKCILPLSLILFIIPLNIFADGGGWAKNFTLESHNIYTEIENPFISLEKELLVFDGKKTSAQFLFRNSSDEDIVLECGFPVRYELKGVVDHEYFLLKNSPYRNPFNPVLSLFQLGSVENLESYYEGRIQPEGILLNEDNNYRFFTNPDDVKSTNLRISQDGNKN